MLFSCVLPALGQTSPVLPLLETQQPVQQFVMAEEPTQPAVAPPTESNVGLSRPDISAGSPAPAPAPAPSATQEATLSSSAIEPIISAKPIGLNAPLEERLANPFSGGLDTPHFLQCKQTGMNLCGTSKDAKAFSTCLKGGHLSGCDQFIAFATMVGMSPKDDIDVIKHYKQLDLLHLIRFGANYPGAYYAIGLNGNLIDLIFGPHMQKLDIQKDIHYPEVVRRYPNVALFSIVDKFPTVQNLPDGAGLQLVFHFQLLNGCHACERAGYANVAYRFSELGALQSVAVQSIEPASPY